jgi:dipeptidyl aminopeptidase/acylaminoacyl peptidase
MPISLYIKSSDALLHCTIWTPVKSRSEGIVFCHGWGGGTPYDDLLSMLAVRGYMVLRFDQRGGYGGSSGHANLSLWPVDMAAGAAAMTGIVDKIWGMGQSTGGTMALVAATQYNCFAGAVSIAPFCSLTRILEDNPNSRAILEARFGPLQEKHFQTANALEIVGGLKKPVLIVQGTANASVPHAHGKLLYEKLRSVALHRSVQGGNHHLNNVDRADPRGYRKLARGTALRQTAGTATDQTGGPRKSFRDSAAALCFDPSSSRKEKTRIVR